MKILIDVGHPADVHTFTPFAHEMQKKGHSIVFTVRQKEVNIELLTFHSFRYYRLGKIFKSFIGKAFGLIYYDVRLLLIAIAEKPDLFLSHGSMYAAQVAWLLRKSHIALEDTGNMLQVRLYLPFTKIVLTPSVLTPDFKNKKIVYSGYHELAYLLPKRFNPDPSIPGKLGLTANDICILLRFVSWDATHDLGHTGISLNNKIRAAKEFSAYGKVFISSQGKLPDTLEKYKLPLHPAELHDFIACCSLVFGESATVSSEAAVLGVPAIYIDNNGRCYTDEEEQKYGLVYNFSESLQDQEKAILKGIELLSAPTLKEEWHLRRQRMLADKIDVTAFLVWFAENYPESAGIMREDPEYQYKFR